MATEDFGQSLYGVAQVVRRNADRLTTSGQGIVDLATSVKDAPKGGGYRVVSSLQLLAGFKSQISHLFQTIAELSPDIVHVHGCFRGIQKSSVLAAKRHGIRG